MKQRAASTTFPSVGSIICRISRLRDEHRKGVEDGIFCYICTRNTLALRLCTIISSLLLYV